MSTRSFQVQLKNQEGEALAKDFETRLVIGNNPRLYTVFGFEFYEEQQSRGQLTFDYTSFVSNTISAVKTLRIPDISNLCLSDDPCLTESEDELFRIVLNYKIPCARSIEISTNSNFALLDRQLKAGKPLIVYTHLSSDDRTYLQTVFERVQGQASRPAPDGYKKSRIRAFEPITLRQLSREVAKSRPNAAIVEFECPDHYLWVHALAIQLENSCKHAKIERYCAQEHRLIVMEILGEEDRKYQVFMPPAQNDEARIQPGDKIQVTFPGRHSGSESWTVVVLPPLANTPEGYLSGQMTRPGKYVAGRKKEDCYDNYKLEAISADVEDPTKKVVEDKGIMVRVSIDSYDALLSRRLSCMQHMANGLYGDAMTEAVVRVLVGRKASSVETFDIFRNIRGEFAGNPEEFITGLNPEQLLAVRACRVAPAGIVSVQGPPGTGKTHFIIEVSTPFIMSKHRRTILATTQTNVGTDHLAKLYQERIDQLAARHPNRPWLQDKYVVRAHINETEMAIYSQKAKEKRRQSMRSATYGEPSEAQKEMLQVLEVAHVIATETQKEQSQSAGVSDRRAREIDLSVGMRMVQMAGIVPGGPKHVDPAKTQLFCARYSSWVQDQHMKDEERDEFWEAAKSLRDYVMKNAAVVCTTITNASANFVGSNLANSTELVIADEMPRCLEADALLLFMGKFNPCGYIMVGDIDQLGPYVESSHEHRKKKTYRDDDSDDYDEDEEYDFNPFTAQLGTSVQERLQKNGFPFTLLKEQHRMDPNLSKDTSEFIYDSQLRDNESTIDRPLAAELQNFNEMKFGIRTNKLLLNMPDIPDCLPSTTRQAINMSRYNEHHVMYSINLAEELTQRFPETSIAILTGYQAQYHLLASAKQQMIFQKASHENISIHKIDTVQGLEFDFVILDQLFLTRGSAGFMRDRRRLNVATSRAKHGMYILADVGAYHKVRYQRSRNNNWVRRFMERWIADGKKDVDTTGLICKYFQPCQTDPQTGERMNS